jgi:hypothetical protein
MPKPRTCRPARLGACAPMLALLIAPACTKPEKVDHGAPPPPVAEGRTPGACADGGGEVGDAISSSFFSRSISSYCIDPEGETRTYGEKGKLDMDAVCTTAFDGECAVYMQFGLKRLVALRYVNGAGGSGTVEVYLSRFENNAGAFGMFTKRVVADADPAEPSTPKPLEAGGAGALGTGRAYAWKGSYVAELQYNNDEETPEALSASSAKILSAIAKDIGSRLPGDAGMPKAAESLPAENRIPNGIQFYPKDAPNLGSTAAAVGFYREGSKRYRMVSALLDDVSAAKETMKAVRLHPGWLPVPGLGDEACATTTPTKSEYVFARQGSRVLGVGDEDFVSAGKGLSLSKDEKVALIKKWLASPAASAKSQP